MQLSLQPTQEIRLLAHSSALWMSTARVYSCGVCGTEQAIHKQDVSTSIIEQYLPDSQHLPAHVVTDVSELTLNRQPCIHQINSIATFTSRASCHIWSLQPCPAIGAEVALQLACLSICLQGMDWILIQGWFSHLISHVNRLNWVPGKGSWESEDMI